VYGAQVRSTTSFPSCHMQTLHGRVVGVSTNRSNLLIEISQFTKSPYQTGIDASRELRQVPYHRNGQYCEYMHVQTLRGLAAGPYVSGHGAIGCCRARSFRTKHITEHSSAAHQYLPWPKRAVDGPLVWLLMHGPDSHRRREPRCAVK
jgi:hypothetical protein